MSELFNHSASDPEMERAQEAARQTFRYFWRELTWEGFRIIPGLDMSAVKAPFFDTEDGPVEQMWLAEIGFDGAMVHGTVLNKPHELSSVHEGDRVALPLERISDWMFSIGGEVYGAHTVQVIRASMSEAERAQHDEAWGLDFGDPRAVRLTYGHAPTDPHPMAVNMAVKLAEAIAEDPARFHGVDDQGHTLLHTLALAGAKGCVTLLLEAGTPCTAGNDGRSPRDLAASLDWSDTVALFDA